jgi:hypothetical protein
VTKAVILVINPGVKLPEGILLEPTTLRCPVVLTTGITRIMPMQLLCFHIEKPTGALAWKPVSCCELPAVAETVVLQGAIFRDSFDTEDEWQKLLANYTSVIREYCKEAGLLALGADPYLPRLREDRKAIRVCVRVPTLKLDPALACTGLTPLLLKDHTISAPGSVTWYKPLEDERASLWRLRVRGIAEAAGMKMCYSAWGSLGVQSPPGTQPSLWHISKLREGTPDAWLLEMLATKGWTDVSIETVRPPATKRGP